MVIAAFIGTEFVLFGALLAIAATFLVLAYKTPVLSNGALDKWGPNGTEKVTYRE